MTTLSPPRPSGPRAGPEAARASSHAPSDPVVWHTLSVAESLRRLDVDPAEGLGSQEIARRLARFGPNELKEVDGVRPWQLLLHQFTEPLVLVLIAAALLSGLVWAFDGHEPLPYEAIVILSIVLLNAGLGFFQEYQAEQAVAALKRMAAPLSTVRRGRRVSQIPAAALVPGDVLLLDAGCRIPADARLFHTANLEVEEAALTGESLPVRKQSAALTDPSLPLGDRTNMLFVGSAVTYGRGEAVVTATGMETQMGAIATLLQAVEEEETPLQRELTRVGKQLGLLVLVVALVVIVTGMLTADQLTSRRMLELFLFGVALAVAAIPEGLPAIVTAVLALGVRRMASRNAIVRRLPAVETLGSATVICSDKTGTLTRNEMCVRRLLLGGERVLAVEGEGYAPSGRFVDEAGQTLPSEDEALRALLRCALLNNDATLLHMEDDQWRIVGDPTEGALVTAAAKIGLDGGRLRREYPRQGEIPFSSERKRMTTLHTVGGQSMAFVKGAPDVVIDLCTSLRRDGCVVPLSDGDRRTILAHNEAFASSALRTLGFASRLLPVQSGAGSEPCAEDVERELVWEGLAGMIDPPRAEAKEAVAQAKGAGIRTIMITGDHQLTALAIATELGIADDQARVVIGQELAEMDEATLAVTVREVNVYARVNPIHKLRIVRALKAQGEVVAMTGDGVNDAPALRQADIGIAMGITGTDVSKEASDMILADDNFATIVAAIGEGRAILDNVRKFIRYLLSSNAGEVLTVFGGMLAAGLLGLYSADGTILLALLAVQILWINLVTDGGPALALGLDTPESGLMERPPRRADEGIITGSMWLLVGLVGLVMMVGTLLVFDAYLPGGLLTPGWLVTLGDDPVRHARSVAFTTLVLFQLFNVFNCRSQQQSALNGQFFQNGWLWLAVIGSVLLQCGILYLPSFQRAFDVTPLSAMDWLVAAVVASSVLVVMESVKRGQRAGKRVITE
ncbi:MAG: cation-translocating P-type ATPase [Caldilineaceae bacterium]|nr:cation-translocating P-type ATPase [Caldilineaceae bacterium]